MGYFDNLNAYMQPSNAPVAKQYDTTFAPFDFGNNVGRNSISATKVRSVYAGNILAGTVIVGLNIGTANGTTGPYVAVNGGSTNITIYDGTNTILLLGKKTGGF